MKTKFIIIGIIFIICLVLGYVVAGKSASLNPETAKSENALPKTFLNLTPAQSDYVILMVDDLTAEKPQITTIWMVFFYPKSQPYLILLPVFPTGNKKANTALQSEFIITPMSGVNQSFWNKLEDDYHIKWEHYIIVDESSLAQITQKLIAEDPPARLLKPNNKRKVSQTLADSSGVIKKICGNLVMEQVSPGMVIDWKSFENHLLSDLHSSTLEKNWNWILSNPLADPCNIISYK